MNNNMITTRSAAIAAIVLSGIIEPFAKVYVKETFDRDDDNKPTDKLHVFDGEKVRETQVRESELIKDAHSFVAHSIEVVDGGIAVGDEVLYNIFGDNLHPELDHIPEVSEAKAPAEVASE